MRKENIMNPENKELANHEICSGKAGKTGDKMRLIVELMNKSQQFVIMDNMADYGDDLAEPLQAIKGS